MQWNLPKGWKGPAIMRKEPLHNTFQALWLSQLYGVSDNLILFIWINPTDTDTNRISVHCVQEWFHSHNREEYYFHLLDVSAPKGRQRVLNKDVESILAISFRNKYYDILGVVFVAEARACQYSPGVLLFSPLSCLPHISWFFEEAILACYWKYRSPSTF